MAIDMKALALAGAAARVSELQAELAAIRKAFPGLKTGARRGGRVAAASDGRMISSGRRRNRRPMTAAQKAEVSRRMKKYWASRRAAKAKGT